MQDNKLASGGLCVLQNVSAFDRRNGYQTLLHPLPLLPDTTTANNGMDTSWVASLRPFGPARHMLGTESSSRSHKLATVRSLVLARNNRLDLMATAIVQEYSRFEKVCTMGATEKVSAADGRKVRWLLIYTVLQTLVSINEAPREVTQRENVPYPLCCHIPNSRPWNREVPSLYGPRQRIQKADALKEGIQPDTGHPYYLNTRRSESSTNLNPQETSSLSSMRHLRRFLTNTSRSQPQISSGIKTVATAAKMKNSAFCEIIVYGYGNGLNQTISDTESPLQRHETRQNRPHREESFDPRLITSDRSSPRSCSSTAQSEYRSHPGLTEDTSSRNSTTTMRTVATAKTDMVDRPDPRITIKHNSYTSLISNPYSSSSSCSCSSVGKVEVAEVGTRPAYQAVRCIS